MAHVAGRRFAGRPSGFKEIAPLNNNRGNNRRRGRGNNRPQGGGNGGQQLNRIDSRARGNAPQLLEKYRKLAHDAHLNGDRVNAEYYLQFADHYFRVIADTRLRQEEQRLRRDDRWQEGGEGFREDGDDSGEFSVESDFPAFDQPVYQRREREDRDGNRDNGRENGNRENTPREGREGGNREGGNRENGRDGNREGGREWRNRRDEQGQRPAREAQSDIEAPAAEVAAEPAEANPFEPAENPFLRPNRAARGLKPRRENRDEGREEARATQDDQPRREERRPRREHRAADAEAGEPAPRIDMAVLPPAIGREPSAGADDAPAPRKRAPRRKPAAGDADGSLQSVD
ncbi:MAG: DUF4167 domain-containing protein [Sphingomonadales bacterium]|nr:DUF4167 domain-containing protein [Sphingomonadales bacterium]